ncbi:MAG: pilus assembly protein [Selenomonadaceae bacterium]|nr:pilus assembly protein [Selenomonadaceae bacterium]
MKRQQGQSVVEFALIAPIVFLMIFGMIWGGIMFMEYMHYSNAVRTAARQIAVVNDAQRLDTIAKQKVWLTNLWKEEVGVEFYQPNVDIHTTEDNKDVLVTVGFARAVNIPNILDAVDFPPKYIKALQYRMKLERAASDTTDSTNTEGTGG